MSAEGWEEGDGVCPTIWDGRVLDSGPCLQNYLCWCCFLSKYLIKKNAETVLEVGARTLSPPCPHSIKEVPLPLGFSTGSFLLVFFLTPWLLDSWLFHGPTSTAAVEVVPNQPILSAGAYGILLRSEKYGFEFCQAEEGFDPGLLLPGQAS